MTHKFTLLDGSVHASRETVDLTVDRNIASAAGGEVNVDDV